MTKPIDIPTRETADFISGHLKPGVSVVEVGCGEGHVASELGKRGFRVKGIDSDRASVDVARTNGIDAELAAWPDVDLKTIDAVVFTRSLHHIEKLTEAIKKAREVLPVKGMILIEDFAFNVTDSNTLDWFLALIGSGRMRPLIEPKPDEFITRMTSAVDTLAEWQDDKHHNLHSAEAMKETIASMFEIAAVTDVPYFYRYLVPVFPETTEAASIVVEVLAEEMRLGISGEIVLVGRRIVAVKR